MRGEGQMREEKGAREAYIVALLPSLSSSHHTHRERDRETETDRERERHTHTLTTKRVICSHNMRNILGSSSARARALSWGE